MRAAVRAFESRIVRCRRGCALGSSGKPATVGYVEQLYYIRRPGSRRRRQHVISISYLA